MKDSKIVTFLMIVIILSLTIVVGISFAYLNTSQTTQNTLGVNVTFGNGVVANFTATGTENISVNVGGNLLLQGQAGNVASNDTSNISISLQSDIKVSCSYDIYWLWDSSTPNQYTKVANNEMTISGSAGTLKIPETQVPNYNSSLKLGTFSIMTNHSTTVQNWQFNLNFYNLSVNQDVHENKTYKGKISIQNAYCGAVDYELASQTTYNAGTYGDTGYYINWGRDFVIEEVLNLPTASQRYVVVGGYDNSSTKEMNIEITNANQLRVYLAKGGVHDMKNGSIPASKDVKIRFKWTASTHSYVATAVNMETGAVVASMNYTYNMTGTAVRTLRIGASDYRSSSSPFKTLTVKSMIIY